MMYNDLITELSKLIPTSERSLIMKNRDSPVAYVVYRFNKGFGTVRVHKYTEDKLFKTWVVLDFIANSTMTFHESIYQDFLTTFNNDLFLSTIDDIYTIL